MRIRSAARAERDADRHLLVPCRGAREQQAGHVRGRDEQQQPDGREEQQHGLPDIGHEIGAQRRQLDARELVAGGEVALERRRHGVHVGLRAVDRLRGLQPRHHREIAVVALRRGIDGGRQRIVRHAPVRRDPGAGSIGVVDRRRHHADDRVWFVVDAERLADRVRPRAEALPPEPVAQDRDPRRARPFVGGGEGAAEHRLHVEHVEEVGVDDRAGDALRPIALRRARSRACRNAAKAVKLC